MMEWLDIVQLSTPRAISGTYSGRTPRGEKETA